MVILRVRLVILRPNTPLLVAGFFIELQQNVA